MLVALLRPFHRNNTYFAANMFCKLAPLVGVKLINRVPKSITDSPKVVIANHQSNYDVITTTAGVTPGVVSVGKKSLKWIPLFGQLYWLAGNILIDRNNKFKAKQTMNDLQSHMRKRNLSIWVFPEGTRSKGRGLLPFKKGAFHIALQAQVPIIPVVLSTLDSLSLNRWDNGYAIVENLEPIDTSKFDESQVKELAEIAHDRMKEKLEQLDAEVAKLNSK
jgi:1-acyl-sn-glycerol-3-phosphate acyltransferase